MEVDFSQVDRLADELMAVPAEVEPKVRKVVARGALNVKNTMRDAARSGGSYRHFHQSISYDVLAGGMAAEIGPDKGRIQGALGNILYFGTSKNAPQLDIMSGLHRESPRLERALIDVVEDIL